MDTGPSDNGWEVIGASVTGAAHRRAGQERQDAIAFWPTRRSAGPSAVLAVSDGHGSLRHFRSAVGARLAVDATLTVLREYVSDDSTRPEGAAQILPQRLVQAWRDAVASHAAARPFAAKEWQALREESPEAREEIEQNPGIAYGATLLAVAIRGAAIVYLQLGDGDILSVDDTGETTRVLQRDPRLIGNQTTSLCQPDAVESFRVRVVTDRNALPALILVATDGYANAFRSDADFRLIGRDYLAMLREQGLDRTAARLDRFLNEASANGSGDDITLGLIARLGGRPAEAAPASGRLEEPAAAPEPKPRQPGDDVPAGTRRQEHADTRARARPSRARRRAALGVIAGLVLAAAAVVPRLIPFQLGRAPVTATPPILVMHTGQAVIPLVVGRVVRAQDLSLDPATSGDPVGVVVPSEDGTRILLRNVSQIAWSVTEGGKNLEVEPGSTIAVSVGVQIRMGTVNATIDRR